MAATCGLALLATLPAQAGRPLATDDAGTTPERTCQVEGWIEGSGNGRALIVAPACGVAPGLEIGADHTHPHPRDGLRAGAGVALKWVAPSWSVETAAGELGFGLKLGAAGERRAGAPWRRTETGALLLASLHATDGWAVHANLGGVRAHGDGTRAAVFNLAVVWAPRADALLFAEVLSNSRREQFGATVALLGARWWLRPDIVGIDLTAGRESGAGAATVWSLGFGWYGLGF